MDKHKVLQSCEMEEKLFLSKNLLQGQCTPTWNEIWLSLNYFVNIKEQKFPSLDVQSWWRHNKGLKLQLYVAQSQTIKLFYLRSNPFPSTSQSCVGLKDKTTIKYIHICDCNIAKYEKIMTVWLLLQYQI